MNRILLLVVSFVIICSCNVSKSLRKERKMWEYKNWPQEFKDRALCLCIINGYNNVNLQDSIRKYDKSFYDPMAIGLFDDAIEPLLKKQLEKMTEDSIKSIGNSPADLKDLLWGKKVISGCTQFFHSKQLDSVMRYQNKYVWPKIKDVTAEIWKKIPTF